MAERLTKLKEEEIIASWTQGVKFDDDGYGDLAFTLQENALKEVAKLPLEDRRKILDIILPEK